MGIFQRLPWRRVPGDLGDRGGQTTAAGRTPLTACAPEPWAQPQGKRSRKGRPLVMGHFQPLVSSENLGGAFPAAPGWFFPSALSCECSSAVQMSSPGLILPTWPCSRLGRSPESGTTGSCHTLFHGRWMTGPSHAVRFPCYLNSATKLSSSFRLHQQNTMDPAASR